MWITEFHYFTITIKEHEKVKKKASICLTAFIFWMNWSYQYSGFILGLLLMCSWQIIFGWCIEKAEADFRTFFSSSKNEQCCFVCTNGSQIFYTNTLIAKHVLSITLYLPVKFEHSANNTKKGKDTGPKTSLSTTSLGADWELWFRDVMLSSASSFMGQISWVEGITACHCSAQKCMLHHSSCLPETSRSDQCGLFISVCS